MKILLISEFFPTGKDLRFSGGVEARTYFIAKNLSKRHQISVICTRQQGAKAQEIIDGIKILRVGPTIPYNAGSGKNINPFSLFNFIMEATRVGKRIEPDVVDGGNFIAHFIAKQISNSKKIPVVFWYPDVFIGNWIKSSGIVSGISGYLLEKFNLTRGADQYISISKTTKDKLIKTGINSSKISVIYCGVDKAEFKSKISKNSDIKITTVSRLVRYKRIKDLVFAFALISQKNPNLQLQIIGRGPEKENLDDLVKNLKLERKVTFKSDLTREDLLREIKSSTIFCLPSEIEGFGISIVEAASAGVPYVVSNIPVFKEITQNGKGGFLFELAQAGDLANKIKKLIEDKSLYTRKQKEAVEMANNYDWAKIAKETESVYRSLR